MTDHCPDFDFQQGRWHVHHRRLRARLAGCHDWEEFAGTCEQRPILGGNGNLEDNTLDLPGGSYCAVALRSWDPASARWAIWWLDGRSPHALDTPVIGGFAGNVGTFHADDALDGRPIRIRFLWLHTDTDAPRWEQAFSANGGESWETNWTMDFTRA
jgi:hypothetical protein